MPTALAETDSDIAACFTVMRQLRPQLVEDEFVSRIRSQMAQGYRLARCDADGRPVAVAGYRVLENLAWGQFLYIDDLVSDEEHRSEGHGERLFGWLIAEAQRLGCGQLHLDSGVQRFAAHRFYLRQRMDITSHHFAIKLT
jgi:GNAT superfamily N-acetyltransferase